MIATAPPITAYGIWIILFWLLAKLTWIVPMFFGFGCGCCEEGCTIFRDDRVEELTDYTVDVPSWFFSSGILSTISAGAVIFVDTPNPDSPFNGTWKSRARIDTLGGSAILLGNFSPPGGADVGFFARMTIDGASSLLEMGTTNGGLETPLGTPKIFTGSLNTWYELKLCWRNIESDNESFVTFRVTGVGGVTATVFDAGAGARVALSAIPNGGQVDFDTLLFQHHPSDTDNCPSCTPLANEDGTEPDDDCEETCEEGVHPNNIVVELEAWENDDCPECDDINGTYVLGWVGGVSPTSICGYEGESCGVWGYGDLDYRLCSANLESCLGFGISVDVNRAEDGTLFIAASVGANIECDPSDFRGADWQFVRALDAAPESLVDCFAVLPGPVPFLCESHNFPDNPCTHGTVRIEL